MQGLVWALKLPQRCLERWPIVTLAVCFAAVLVVFVASPVTISADSRWSLHTAQSLLHGEAGRLDAYTEALKAQQNYAIDLIDGHPRTFFPMGVSFLAMPFVAVMSAINPRFDSTLKQGIAHGSEKFVASFYGALASALFCWLIWIVFRDGLLAACGLVLFAYATSAWSLTSRGLEQHGPAMLMFIVTAILLVYGSRQSKFVRYAALPLS